LPDAIQPWFATALGDLFSRHADGRVYWLDAGSGQAQVVASNEDEFRSSLTNSDNMDYWFGPSLVERLREAGIAREPRQCYSYVQLPILGGNYEIDNFRVYDVVTHFRVWGPIHEKLKHLPDGTTFEFRISE
jgi:hypothetical protein